MTNSLDNQENKREDKYVNKEGYSMRHTKCGSRLLLKTALGRVPFCEECQCYATKPTDYEKYLP